MAQSFTEWVEEVLNLKPNDKNQSQAGETVVIKTRLQKQQEKAAAEAERLSKIQPEKKPMDKKTAKLPVEAGAPLSQGLNHRKNLK